MAIHPFRAARDAFIDDLKGGLRDVLLRKQEAGSNIVKLAMQIKALARGDIKGFAETLVDVRETRKEITALGESMTETDKELAKRLGLLETVLEEQTKALSTRLDKVATILESRPQTPRSDKIIMPSELRAVQAKNGRMLIQDVKIGRFAKAHKDDEDDKKDGEVDILRKILSFEKKIFEQGKQAHIDWKKTFGTGTGGGSGGGTQGGYSRGGGGYNRGGSGGRPGPQAPAAPGNSLLGGLWDSAKGYAGDALAGAVGAGKMGLSRVLPFLRGSVGPAATIGVGLKAISSIQEQKDKLIQPGSVHDVKSLTRFIDPRLHDAIYGKDQPQAVIPNQADAEALKKLIALKKELEDELEDVKRKGPSQRNARNYRVDELQQRLGSLNAEIGSFQSGGLQGGYGASGGGMGVRAQRAQNIPGVVPAPGQTMSQAQADARQRLEQAQMPSYNPQMSPSAAAGAGPMGLPGGLGNAAPSSITGLPLSVTAGADSSSSALKNANGTTISTASTDMPAYQRALLDTVSKYESGGKGQGYNTIVGGGTFEGNQHPGVVGMSTGYGPSNAAGRYQFLKSTWDSTTKAYNAQNPNNPITDFSPKNQDRAAYFLAQGDYKKRTGRDLDTDLKNGDYSKIQDGLGGSGRQTTWQGFQGKSDIPDVMASNLKKNQDYATNSAMVKIDPNAVASLPNGGVGSVPRASMADIGGVAGDPKNAMFATVAPGMKPGSGGMVDPSNFDQIKGTANLARKNFDASYYGDPMSPAFKTDNLTTVKLDSGKTVQVNSVAAESYRGFLNELEGSGYKIGSLSGYANRANVNNPSLLSMHAMGTAIDINPAQNPNQPGQTGPGITNMPSNISDMAAKYGISWGGDWKNLKDTMHFEYAGQLADKLKQGGMPAAQAEAIAGMPQSPGIPGAVPMSAGTLPGGGKPIVVPQIADAYGRAESGNRNFGFGPDGFMGQQLGKTGYSNVGTAGAFGLPDGVKPGADPSKMTPIPVQIAAVGQKTISTNNVDSFTAKGLAQDTGESMAQFSARNAEGYAQYAKTQGPAASVTARTATPAKAQSTDDWLNENMSDQGADAVKQKIKSADASAKAFADDFDTRFNAKGTSAAPAEMPVTPRAKTPDPAPPPPPPPVSAKDEDSGSSEKSGGGKSASDDDDGGADDDDTSGHGKKMDSIEHSINDFGLKSLNTPSYA